MSDELVPDAVMDALQKAIDKTSRELRLLETALNSYKEAGLGIWLKRVHEEEVSLMVKGNEQVAQVVEALHGAGYEVAK